ncbi:type VI secretion system tube protein Hcp [Roseateles amylovorans]|uniref:Type VI secretion system tube protein Hcp n=1 Tax=Roseateles amylovorans TaxID=2978473 RepID=A0ABY6B1E1_9BURK|nr:type VI secretion system tube protein Hcp [Roseateles amylovorans]UXH78519.1 type VI secretion system tube protein Hcp [Roseateles amylovorans]
MMSVQPASRPASSPAAGPAPALVRHYLSLTAPDGRLLAGDSVVAGLRDWIELQACEWSQQVEPALPEAAALPSAFRLFKRMDRASTALLGALTRQLRLKAVIRVEGAAAAHYPLTLRLHDARLIDYQVTISQDGSSAAIQELLSLDFSRLEMDYRWEDGKTTSVQLQRPPGASLRAADGRRAAGVQAATAMAVGLSFPSARSSSPSSLSGAASPQALTAELLSDVMAHLATSQVGDRAAASADRAAWRLTDGPVTVQPLEQLWASWRRSAE